MSDKKARPFLEGWFAQGEAGGELIGTRCKSCGTYYFPRQSRFCRNPACDGEQFEESALSRHGRLWSYTNACYQPPEPFISGTPFEPFAIAAVQLDRECMIVLGPVVQGIGVDDLEVGMPMELVIETLCDTAEERLLTWKWKPVA